MKYKVIAFFLILTLMSWAQTATQNNATSAAEQKVDQTKPACPCCDTTKQTKDHHASCMCKSSAKNADGKMACCSGKDASCCGKDDQSCRKGDKTSASCCADCKDHDKACCAAGDGTKTAAMNCCGAECPMHHGHHGDAKE